MSWHVLPVAYGLTPFFYNETSYDYECAQKVNALFRTYSCHSLPHLDPYYLCGFQSASPFVPGCECIFRPGKSTIPLNTHKQNRDTFNKRIHQLRKVLSEEPFPTSAVSAKKALSSSEEPILLVGLCSSDEEAEMRQLLAAVSVQSSVEKLDVMNKKLKLDKRFANLKRSRQL